MDLDRLALQLGQFRKALAALADAIETDEGDKKSRDSVLLSYVFTFEMAWKSLKAALAVRGLNASDYAAAVLKAGFQAGLIQDADAWDKLRNYRNDVSHAYNEDKAVAIAAFVHDTALARLQELLARLERND